jgi:hypothetical protein
MTDSEIIDKLGGTTKVAAALSVDPRVVSNWRTRNISGVGRYKITELAKRLKVSLPKDFMRVAG